MSEGRSSSLLLALSLGSLATGCFDKAVELDLVIGSSVADVDVSCVNNVHVMLHKEDPFAPPAQQCVNVTAPTSLADLQRQIRGTFEMTFPDDLIAVELRAVTGAIPGLCGTGTAVVYAGQEYFGQAKVSLRAAAALDCSALQSEPRTVQAIDFFALASTPPGAPPICEPPLGLTEISVGTIRPTQISLPDFPNSVIDAGAFARLTPDGTARLPAWTQAVGKACLAAGNFELYGASCIYPDRPNACAPAGVTEVALVSDLDAFESYDLTLLASYQNVVFGLVWDSVAGAPIANATVTLPEGKGEVVFVDPAGLPRVAPSGSGLATTASGMFMAYVNEPVRAAISDGRSSTTIQLGGAFTFGSAAIISLR
jgi:hypothetical protein